MSADNEKLVQPIDSREPYTYGTSQDKIHKNKETGYGNARNAQLDEIRGENMKENNPKWANFSHANKKLIIGGSGSGKNTLLNLIIKKMLIKYTYTQKIHTNQKYKLLIIKRKTKVWV